MSISSSCFCPFFRFRFRVSHFFRRGKIDFFSPRKKRHPIFETKFYSSAIEERKKRAGKIRSRGRSFSLGGEREREEEEEENQRRLLAAVEAALALLLLAVAAVAVAAAASLFLAARGGGGGGGGAAVAAVAFLCCCRGADAGFSFAAAAAAEAVLAAAAVGGGGAATEALSLRLGAARVISFSRAISAATSSLEGFLVLFFLLRFGGWKGRRRWARERERESVVARRGWSFARSLAALFHFILLFPSLSLSTHFFFSPPPNRAGRKHQTKANNHTV